MDAELSDGFAVTVLAAPGGPSALVRLAGEIDMAASAALSEAADRLAAAAPASVLIDLADVTFAGATLSNFLARMHQSLPADSTMQLCRPTTRTRRILDLTGMNEIATLRTDLPSLAHGGADRRPSPPGF